MNFFSNNSSDQWIWIIIIAVIVFCVCGDNQSSDDYDCCKPIKPQYKPCPPPCKPCPPPKCECDPCC